LAIVVQFAVEEIIGGAGYAGNLPNHSAVFSRRIPAGGVHSMDVAFLRV
jgi:hypothetical protein